MAQDPVRRGRGNGNGNGNGPGNGPGNNHGNANSIQYGWNNAQSSTEQVREILHVFFKRKRWIGGLFLAVTLPGLVAVSFRKPAYLASAKVMISTQRSDPTLQPTDLTKLETIQLNESLVNSEVQVIGSRDLLERVVRTLALPDSDDGQPLLTSTHRSFGDEVINLGQNLSVTPIKASNVIEIDYKASDPSYAARVVNRVVDEYLAYHAMVHGNKGLTRFYDEQRRDLARHLHRAEAALAAFTAREGIVSPKDEIQASVRMVAQVNSALQDVTTNIAGTEERVRAIRDQIAAVPEVVKHSQYLEVNPVITQLTAQLVDRQLDRLALLHRFTKKDRLVTDNAQEIKEIKGELANEQRAHPTIVTHQMYRTNPIREDRVRTLLDLESTLRQYRAQQATLEEQLSQVNRRLVSLQQKSIDYDRLDEEVQNSRQTYELYVKREQEARISQAMDEQKLVNIDVVQRPALPLPRADTRRISVALLMIAGLVVGVAAAFGREYIGRSLSSERDVHRYLGLPLLASIGDNPRA